MENGHVREEARNESRTHLAVASIVCIVYVSILSSAKFANFALEFFFTCTSHDGVGLSLEIAMAPQQLALVLQRESVVNRSVTNRTELQSCNPGGDARAGVIPSRVAANCAAFSVNRCA